MSELKALAQHRWEDILTHFGLDQRYLNGKHTDCPVCKDGNDRFRFDNSQGYGEYFCSHCPHGDGFDLLAGFTGNDLKTVIHDVRNMLGQTQMKPARKIDTSNARKRLRETWAASKPLSKGCPTHRYLVGRGLAGLDFGSLKDLRCHPALKYWDKDDNGELYHLATFPAMIGLIKDPAEDAISLHATYISSDWRKAAVDTPRKIMTPVKPKTAGAVMMQDYSADKVLCVAEGIETALAMKLLFPDVVPWACISAGNMEKFTAPTDATVYIAADNDLSYTGQAAAFSLAKMLVRKKHEVSVLTPPNMGTDWLDELNMRRRAVA